MRALMAGVALSVAAATPLVVLAQPQNGLDRLAASLGYRLTIVNNHPANCPDKRACFLSEIEISTPDTLPAIPQGLEVRFGFPTRILSVESDVWQHRFINGDLNALSLKPGKHLEPGSLYKVRIIGLNSFFSRVYVMPNVHLTAPGHAAVVVAATRTGLDPETGVETLPFVAPMTDEAKLATASPQDRTRWWTPEAAFDRYLERGAPAVPDVVILPKPVSATRPAGSLVDLTRGMRFSVVGLDRRELDAAIAAVGVAGRPSGVPLKIARNTTLQAEAYRLIVGDGRISIAAADAAGANHALRSLAQQAAFEHNRLRPLVIEDAPRYPFRGLHLDLARNFHSKAEVLKLLEQMATYKLNAMHLHLGDDEGWRLQIAGLPELTQIGGYRCYDDDEKTCLQPQLGADPRRDAATNGFLSQDDYVEILRAAKARGIEVIPSFDMPGHSRAAIRSMEVRYDRLMAQGRRTEAERFRLLEPEDATVYRSIQNYSDNTLNVCREPTYRFVNKVLDEVQALHRRAGAPLQTYHIGADETAGAWSDSPACKALMAQTGLQPKQLGAHFIERVSKDLAARGVRVAGWSDGLGHTAPERMPADVQTNIWGLLHTGGVREAHEQAARGWRVVLSIPDMGYLDMPNIVDPEERGYDWAARDIDTWKVFAFMPGNLPANGSVRTNLLNQPTPVTDSVPMPAGRTIRGMQAQLWSETIRTDAQVDYMIFPRVLAFAERAWSRPAWEPAYVPGRAYTYSDGQVDRSIIRTGWSDFAGRASVALAHLDVVGVDYRVGPPGARIRSGKLEALAEFPSLAVEYRENGGRWRSYARPVDVSGRVEVRTRSADGRRAGRAVLVPQPN
jgi:hexosaminidase